MGYFLKFAKIEKSLLVTIAISSVLLIISLTLYLSYVAGKFVPFLMGGMSVFVCFYAGSLFMLCMDNKTEIYTIFSKASFCIYLTHMIFVKILQKIDFANLFPGIAGIPVAIIFIILVGLLFYGVLSKIPVVNKYLI